jgi:hypothetical protein
MSAPQTQIRKEVQVNMALKNPQEPIFEAFYLARSTFIGVLPVLAQNDLE